MDSGILHMEKRAPPFLIKRISSIVAMHFGIIVHGAIAKAVGVGQNDGRVESGDEARFQGVILSSIPQ